MATDKHVPLPAPLGQQTLGFLLADVSRLMRRAFRQRLAGSGLTHAQARALVHIARHEGVRQIELAELLDVQPITLARLIDQLAHAGLVERRPDSEDRRAYRIFLQAAAAAHLKTIARAVTEVHAQALRDVGERQSAAVVSALRRMRDNLMSS